MLGCCLLVPICTGKVYVQFCCRMLFLSILFAFFLVFVFSCWEKKKDEEKEKKIPGKNTWWKIQKATTPFPTEQKNEMKKKNENDKTANKWRRRMKNRVKKTRRYFEYFSACNLAENMSSIQCVNANLQIHFFQFAECNRLLLFSPFSRYSFDALNWILLSCVRESLYVTLPFLLIPLLIVCILWHIECNFFIF